jgi:ABC-type multidrug transport system ATPase subunit
LRADEPTSDAPPAPPPPPPVVVADGLLAGGARGVVFGPVSLRVAAGELLAVAGPGGSGRTSLLLALAGRLRTAGGRAVVDGHALDEDAAAVRRSVAVARADAIVDLDEQWTVGDAIANRGVLSGGRAAEAAVRARLAAAGAELSSGTPLHALSAVQRTLLDVALAAAEDRPVLVADDVERGLTPPEAARVWRALAAVAADGRAVLAATTDARAARAAGAAVLELERGP